MLKLTISLLILITSNNILAKCNGTKIRDLYQVCKASPPFEVINLKNNEKYISKDEEWEICSSSGKCNGFINDDKLKLYFNSAIAIDSRVISTDLEVTSGISLNCLSVPELYFEEKGTKENNGADSIFDLVDFLKDRIREVKENTAYHMRYYNNLKKLVEEYGENYSFIYENNFEKSFEYDIYEKPGTYLSDLATYRITLLQTESNLEWLLKKYDLNELNISLNLKNNERIAKLFNEFRDKTGFPNNIEELKEAIRKKIEGVDEERRRIQDWLIQKGINERIEFERSLPNTLKFVNLIDSKKSEIKFDFEYRLNKAIKSESLDEAKSTYEEYFLRLGELDRVLSFQVTSESKKKKYESYLSFMKKELTDAKKRIDNISIKLSTDSTPTVAKKYTESVDAGVTKHTDLDRDIDRVKTVSETVLDPTTGNSTKITVSEVDWHAYESDGIGGVITRSGKSVILIKTETNSQGIVINELKREVSKYLNTIFNEIREFPPIDLQPVGKKMDAIINHKEQLNQTKVGREVVKNTEELQLLTREATKKRDRAEKDVAKEIDTHAERRGRNEPPLTFPKQPAPPVSTQNNSDDSIAYDIGLNIIYYGSALSYPIGSAVEVVELICAMIYNVDLFGNEVDNVDKMIIGLGILLPHVTKIPGVKQTLKAMISYLKKAGVPAKNALLRIFKKGKEATVKLFADAEKGVSHGLNIFEDLGGEFLENAGEIVESAQALGIKTKDAIFKLSKAVTSIKASPFDLKPTHRINPSGANYKNVLEQLKSDKQMRETIKYVEFKGEKYIVDGHHRVRAAKELKMDKIPIEEVKLPYQGYKTIEDLF